MRRLCFFTVAVFLLSGLFLPAAAYAEYLGPGSTPELTTVAEVLANGKEDMEVTLRGRLVKKVSDEKYLLDDGTGSIRVEIENEVFPAEKITDKTTVEINGEVEKAFLHSPEIDVDFIRVIPE